MANEKLICMSVHRTTEVGGRALKINEAKPKTDAPRGGGQRFGGGGGGSRDDYQGHARQPREPRW